MCRSFEKRDVSSTKILHIDIIPSGRNKRGPNRDPCGMPELNFLHPDI